MTLAELESSLPNGLHDAELHGYAVDYAQQKLILELTIWVGTMRDAPESRETYNEGRIEISGLIFLAVEAPAANYPYAKSGTLTIDACDMTQNVDPGLLKSLPSDAFVRSLWISEWNAFMHLAARSASMEWLSETKVRAGSNAQS
jgi:hypothetical protein